MKLIQLFTLLLMSISFMMCKNSVIEDSEVSLKHPKLSATQIEPRFMDINNKVVPGVVELTLNIATQTEINTLKGLFVSAKHQCHDLHMHMTLDEDWKATRPDSSVVTQKSLMEANIRCIGAVVNHYNHLIDIGYTLPDKYPKVLSFDTCCKQVEELNLDQEYIDPLSDSQEDSR